VNGLGSWRKVSIKGEGSLKGRKIDNINGKQLQRHDGGGGWFGVEDCTEEVKKSAGEEKEKVRGGSRR